MKKTPLKRTPLKRSTYELKRTPLSRSTKPLKRTPLSSAQKPLKRTRLKKRSKKMQALYDAPDGRKQFVAVFLADNPYCMVKWENCQVGSIDVHEVIPRGIGGAIVPGEKADRQGQRFVAICRRCHGDLDLQSLRARHEGWLHSYNASSRQDLIDEEIKRRAIRE